MEDTKEQQPFLTIVAHKLRSMHTLDRIALTVAAIIIVVVAVLITKHVARDREITTARKTASAAVADLAKENTAALVALGNADFQKSTSAAKLKSALTFTFDNKPVTFAELYGSTTPTVDSTVVANNGTGQHVVFIYKYNSLKLPYFVRVDTINPAGKNHWYLQGLSFSTDELKLQTGISSSPTDQTPTTTAPSI